MESVGFIGLGIMGEPMVINLLNSNQKVYINDADFSKYKELEEKGAIPADLDEIASKCKVIFLSLPDGSVSKEVLLKKDSLYKKLEAKSIVIDTSSIKPSQSKEISKELLLHNVYYLDAPVSGGENGAISGNLAFMVGGNEKAFNKAKPYFEILGSSALYMGKSGNGNLTKLANQMIVNLNIAVVSEAMVLATKAGVEPESVFKAIRGGLAGSAVLENTFPRLLERDFNPGGKISTNHKDIKNVIESAQELMVPIPLTSMLFEIQQTLMVHGLQNEDHSSYVKFFEKLADVEVK